MHFCLVSYYFTDTATRGVLFKKTVLYRQKTQSIKTSTLARRTFMSLLHQINYLFIKGS